MGLFSRLGQATYLLSKALDSVSSASTNEDLNAFDEDTAQLRRTLLSLVTVADQEAVVRQLEFCSQSALCFRWVNPLEVKSTYCFFKT